jgi:hypothetical protein
MKAFIWGSLTESITVEGVFQLMDWKTNHPKHEVISAETYVRLQSHFENEYSSVFQLRDKVFIAL